MAFRITGIFHPVWCGLLLSVAAWARADEPAARVEGPLSPEKALAAFRLEPGLKIELVAAEPTVESPVAIAFDERGRLFVAENRGYPTGPGEGQPPAGRIALLEDADGDGRFEKRTDFATGLTFPNGLMPWQGGLIVTCAPEVLYLKDTDGDGKADLRKVLFTGFATTGSTQLRVSHPILGPDNWVYLTSGLTGGDVVSPDFPDRPPVVLKRTDFRFRPGGTEYEAADGGAQFGQTFDDWGRRFICYNRVQVQHVVLPSRVLKRNPQLAFSETVQNCPAELSPEPPKGHGAAARLFPISSNVTTADSHAGTFTAACAVTVYRGTGLPESYRGGVFSCDPTGNLIHFDRLESSGATFSAWRAREEIEFVASPDDWFRPVFLAHGPEGALYVCDMYRKTIEHPDYLPVEIRKHTNFEGGKGMGRIYRVVRGDVAPPRMQARRKVDLTAASVADLCRMLADDDGWKRSTAQRLLLERRAPEAEILLKKSLAGSGPEAALALRLLESFGALENAAVARCLAHPAAGVREVALEIAESRLASASELLEPVLALADDRHPRVRFQCAIACGASPDPRATQAIARIALRDSADRWLRAAAFSSIAGRESAFLDELLAHRGADAAGGTELYSELGRLLGASRPRESWPRLVHRILQVATGEFEISASLLTGLADALRNKGAARDAGSLLASLVAPEKGERITDASALAVLVSTALRIAGDADQPVARRQIALALLAHADFAQAGAPLLALVDTLQPGAVQSGAVRALGNMTDSKIATTLLDESRFSAYTPTLREEVLSALLAAPQHLPGILAALESEAIPAVAIDSLRRKRLTEHRDPSIRERAARLFAAGSSGDRAKVYEDYKNVLELSPEPENGRAVFKKTCAVCHRLDRDGTPVGPDLFGIRNQPKEAILLHILVPEAEITPGYSAYILETKSGRVLTGLVASETATSVTLRQQLGKEETVLRSDIESLVSSKLSLMPQSLEKTLSRQDLADLVSYLKGEQKAK
ncbi:MAG: c-type cytochrome [Planctomycetia bacterium]|nr:c-type cytochrome [Planctomycetia bacterium]